VSSDLNPEQSYYYQHFEVNSYSCIKRDTSKPLAEKCTEQTPQEMEERMKVFEP
jgi:hypothetical protein